MVFEREKGVLQRQKTHFFKFLFGTKNQRTIKKIQPIVNKINEFEKIIGILDDKDLFLKILNHTLR